MIKALRIAMYGALVAWIILLGPHALLPPVLNWIGPQLMSLVAWLGFIPLLAIVSWFKVPNRIAGALVMGWYFAMMALTCLGYIAGGEFSTDGLRW